MTSPVRGPTVYRYSGRSDGRTSGDPGRNERQLVSLHCAISQRERELIALLAAGATDRQIAGCLFISIATVRSHLDRIRDKTGRRRRAQLALLAIELGLLDMDADRSGQQWSKRRPTPEADWS